MTKPNTESPLKKLQNPLMREMMQTHFASAVESGDSKKIDDLANLVDTFNATLAAGAKKDGAAVSVIYNLRGRSKEPIQISLTPEQIADAHTKAIQDPLSYLDFETKQKYIKSAQDNIKKDPTIKDKSAASKKASYDPLPYLSTSDQASIQQAASNNVIERTMNRLTTEARSKRDLNPEKSLNPEELAQAKAIDAVQKVIDERGHFFHKTSDTERLLRYINLLLSHSSSNPLPLVTKMEKAIDDELNAQKSHLNNMVAAVQAVKETQTFSHFGNNVGLKHEIKETQLQVTALEHCKKQFEANKIQILGRPQKEFNRPSTSKTIEASTPEISISTGRKPGV